MKAALVNSGEDMGTADMPGDQEGWGRIHLDNTLYFVGDARRLRVSTARQ